MGQRVIPETPDVSRFMELLCHLLVKDHVHPMWSDINGVFSHKLQDVLDGSDVRQTSQPDAVSRAASGEEGRRG